MKNSSYWEKAAIKLLRLEIIKSGYTNEQFVAVLNDYGETVSLEVFKVRLYRGKFSTAFFLKCMDVLEVDSIDLRPLKKMLSTGD